MDHKTAERAMAVEKYLLDECSPEEKDAFEEHFFSCDECAREIKAGAAFMEQARESLKSGEASARSAGFPAKPRGAKPHRRAWFDWLRPAFAVPAMAFMLAVVAFQNLVQFPALRASVAAMNAPEVLPYADLKSGSSRGDEPAVEAKVGEVFQLTIDIPDASNGIHLAELLDATGRRLWTLAIPEGASKDALALKMPANLPAGGYTLVVRRAGNPGEGGAEVSSYAFVLKRL